MPLAADDLDKILSSVTQQYQEFIKTPDKDGDAHKFSIGLQFIGAINFCNNLIAKERGSAVPPQAVPQTRGPSAPNLRG